MFNTTKHAACPTGPAANTLSTEIAYFEGPVPAGAGGLVQNLEATTTTAPTGDGTYTADVMDSTTNAVLLSCTVTSAAAFCQNTGSAVVAAGHYLQVRITNNPNTGSALAQSWRVTFRY